MKPRTELHRVVDISVPGGSTLRVSLVRDGPEGPALVLAHGFGGGAEPFRRPDWCGLPIQTDLGRLRDLCAKAGTTLAALDDHLSDRRRGGGGDQYSLFGGSGAGPAPVSPPAPYASDPCARAAVPDRTGSHDRTAA